MRFVALIPARGGSKGIIHKNIAMCAGRPLMEYTINAALESKRIDRIFLSTDDKKIALFGRDHGVEVPFIRPEEVARDDTPMIDVISHFMKWLDAEGEYIDGLLLLQPTSPLRQGFHIDEAVKLFEHEKPKSLVSVVEVPHNFSPTSIMDLDRGRLVPYSDKSIHRRQDKPKYYARNGPAILIISKDAILAGNCYAAPCVGYVMDYWSSVDVDDCDTLRTAELFIKDRNRLLNA